MPQPILQPSEKETTTTKERETMITEDQAFQVSMSIFQNEGRAARELSDAEIFGYLVDRGIEETAENAKAVREA